MPARQPLLLIFGSGDDADRVSQSGNRTYVTGSTDLGRLLPNRDLLHRLIVRPDSTEDLSGYLVIANMITEAENSANVLRNLGRLLTGLEARIINPPAAVLRTTRDQVAQLLAGIPGLIAPKTIRLRGDEPGDARRTIEEAGLALPIIVREVGTHTGKTAALHANVDGAAAALEPGREYIATEFVDFSDDQGVYRKYRVYFIGPHRILRHMYASDHWNVHSPDRARFMAPRSEIVAQERALISNPQPFGPRVEEVFNAIRARMPLDFFGLDFALMPDGGDVLLFEANATMSFFPLMRVEDPIFTYLSACVPPAQAAFMELVGLG